MVLVVLLRSFGSQDAHRLVGAFFNLPGGSSRLVQARFSSVGGQRPGLPWTLYLGEKRG